MPPAAQSGQQSEKQSRTVVSIPGELVSDIDKAINEDGGEALKALGVEAESLRQGFVHKLIRAGLAARATDNGSK